MAHIYTKLLLLISFLASQYGLGTSFTIDIQTASTDGMLNNKVNISCLPDRKEALVMEIVKGEGEGDPIATIRQTTNIISYGVGMGQNFQIEGDLSRDNVQDYLRLTITNPGITDLGRYQCIMIYIDATGDLEEKKTARNLTLEDLDILMLVNFLMTKVSNMENTIKQLQDAKPETQTKDQVSWLGRQLQDQQDQLVNQSHQVRTRIDRLEDKTDNQTTMISDMDKRVTALRIKEEEHDKFFSNQSLIINNLVEKDTTLTGFSAGYDTSDKLTVNGVMVFRTVFANIGGNYNSNNGLYTAPRDGLYIFHLVIMARYTDNVLQVKLVANGKEVAKAYTYVSSYYEQSSATTFVQLVKGHVVKAVVVSVGGGNMAYQSPYSMFTGYLLKAV